MSYDARATIDWYRTPLAPETFKALNDRSDLLGFLQAGGYFATLCLTAGMALYSCAHWHWGLTVLLVFLHGTVSHFYINGVHELVHNTVFRSRWLNGFFVRLLGFFGWCDWVWFTTSHANHHRYTLHPPRDGEVVLPYKGLGLKSFLKQGFLAPTRPYQLFKGAFNTARGKLEGAWTLALFPPDQPAARRRLFNWNRFVFAGHLVILMGAITAGVLTR